MTVLNSSGWNSFLTACPLLPSWRITVVCPVQFYLNGNSQLIPPVRKVSFLSIFLVSGLDLLCLFVVWYHPFSQGSRETDNVFQLVKLNQTVSHACGNFSHVFVAELAVWVSVDQLTTIGRSVFSLVLPGSITPEWLALCCWVYVLKEHCTWVVNSWAWYLCPGCCCTLAHWF